MKLYKLDQSPALYIEGGNIDLSILIHVMPNGHYMLIDNDDLEHATVFTAQGGKMLVGIKSEAPLEVPLITRWPPKQS